MSNLIEYQRGSLWRKPTHFGTVASKIRSRVFTDSFGNAKSRGCHANTELNNSAWSVHTNLADALKQHGKVFVLELGYPYTSIRTPLLHRPPQIRKGVNI
jgi:hypothetical protein